MLVSRDASVLLLLAKTHCKVFSMLTLSDAECFMQSFPLRLRSTTAATSDLHCRGQTRLEKMLRNSSPTRRCFLWPPIPKEGAKKFHSTGQSRCHDCLDAKRSKRRLEWQVSKPQTCKWLQELWPSVGGRVQGGVCHAEPGQEGVTRWPCASVFSSGKRQEHRPAFSVIVTSWFIVLIMKH